MSRIDISTFFTFPRTCQQLWYVVYTSGNPSGLEVYGEMLVRVVIFRGLLSRHWYWSVEAEFNLIINLSNLLVLDRPQFRSPDPRTVTYLPCSVTDQCSSYLRYVKTEIRSVIVAWKKTIHRALGKMP